MLKKLILTAILACLFLRLQAADIYGTNVLTFNVAYSTNGINWTNLIQADTTKTELITETNLNRFYRAEHIWVDTAHNPAIAALVVAWGDTPDTIYESNKTAALGFYVPQSMTNSMFQPWVTITNIPLPMDTNSYPSGDTNPPTGP